MPLNRRGLKPIKSMRQNWKEHFHGRELARILNVLTNKKGSSVCGLRDPLFQVKMKKRPDLTNKKSMRFTVFSSSRRSLSIYSERMLASNSGDQDPKKLEWRYRVKDRAHIPDFYEAMPDNVTV